MSRPASVRPLRPARLDASSTAPMQIVHVATVTDTFRSSPDRIYRVLKGVAEGHGGELEWAEVIDRTGDRLLCDFWTEIGLARGCSIRVRTRETVELDPPLTLHYRHRSGPSRGLAETISIGAASRGLTRVTYRAFYASPWRSFSLLFAFFAKPIAHLFMRAHYRELRRSVERVPAEKVSRG